MKKFNLFAIGVVAMLMAAVNVSAARVNYKALTKLEEDNLVTISSNRDELTYTLNSSLGESAIEIDKGDITVDLNGNTVLNVKVSADNVTFKDSAASGSITNLELNATMTVKTGNTTLQNTVVTNKGTLTVEEVAQVGEIVNSGKLTVSGIVNKISVSDGTVTITDDAVLGNGRISLFNEVTGGTVTIAEDATIPAGYFKVAGDKASVISYSTSNCMTGKTVDDIHIKGTDKDGNFFHTIVPISDLKFDVKILDKDEEEVSGNLVKDEVYTLVVVEYWNGLEVADNVGMAMDILTKTFKVTSGDILVKYDGEDAEPNQYIAIADGKATFEITVENLNDSHSSEHLLKVEADSEHSTLKPSEEPEPGDEPGTTPGDEPGTTPGDEPGTTTPSDEEENPNTLDNVTSVAPMGGISLAIAAAGIATLKKREN